MSRARRAWRCRGSAAPAVEFTKPAGPGERMTWKGSVRQVKHANRIPGHKVPRVGPLSWDDLCHLVPALKRLKALAALGLTDPERSGDHCPQWRWKESTGINGPIAREVRALVGWARQQKQGDGRLFSRDAFNTAEAAMLDAIPKCLDNCYCKLTEAQKITKRTGIVLPGNLGEKIGKDRP